MDVYKIIEELKVVPVVVIEDEKDAINLAKALCEGGLPVAEVTFRTKAAKGSISLISENVPEMLVGAGTILSIDQAKEAIDAGAKFIVSPGFDEGVVDYCISENVPVFPGCITPTEIMKAMSMGLNTVKFFPAEQFGGVNTIKALAAPFKDIKFMPTGGISLNNLKEYLSVKNVVACGGSYMVKKDLIAEGKFDEIKQLTAKTLEIVKNI